MTNKYRPTAQKMWGKDSLPAQWLFVGAVVGLWQGNPFQIPQWLWLLLVSSPIVLIIILLVIGIIVLLFILWLRNRRRAASPPISPESLAELPVQPPPASSPRSPDLEKTRPGSAVKPTAPETLVLAPEQEPHTMPVSGQRPADIRWQIAGLTDVGLKRELNEDSLLMAEATTPDGIPYGLYVVADGLGGHQSGEVASQLTIEAILNHFQQHPIQSVADRFDEWLTQAAHDANRAVLDHQADRKEARKMGSTVVMALVIEGKAHIANVGDSRAYLLTATGIDQISEDHSLVERLVQIGQLTRDEARRHKNRNVLYNTIGDRPEMEVGLYQAQLEPGDRLLLCSDGLSGMITDDEMLTISRNQPDPAKACQALVRAAKSAGGTDNITVIIVQMQ